MLLNLRKIDPAKIQIINVITVDGATGGASRAVQHMEKLVTSAVERTTLKLCADPVRDQTVNMEIKGLAGPVIDVHIDVMCMKLMSVVMMAPLKI